jgi:glycosyltransferase involved in cell wall biosynthesis
MPERASKLRVLTVHNFYQRPGGEDFIFSSERDLLRQFGHEVSEYTDTNLRIKTTNPVRVAVEAIWSTDSYNRILAALRECHPDIVHFHNTFSVISPSAYYACRKYGVPVVQTIQNYRLLCPSANFLRNRQPCEECLGKTPPWPAVVHGCYHTSGIQTSVIALMLTYHRWRRTWQTKVDAFIPPTNFLREKLILGGIPPENIFVKPNGLHPDPGQTDAPREYILSIGRFSEEKGLRLLFDAWRSHPEIPFRVIGSGPMENEIRRSIGNANVSISNWLPHPEAIQAIKNARCLVLPSICYEGFPMIIAEASGCGVPVIASRLGAMTEIIEDGKNGLLFTPGNGAEFAQKIEWAWNHPGELARMGKAARQEYEEKYSAERNYENLVNIYQSALERYSRGSN